MVHILYALIGLLVLAAAVSPVEAAVVSADDPHFGPGSIVVDQNTGYEWLSPHFSTNRSLDDVSLQFGIGGDYEGFRYATRDELIAFWQSAGLSVGFYFPTGPYQAFLSLMGGPTDVITPGVYERIVAYVSPPQAPGQYDVPDVGLFSANGFANPDNCCVSSSLVLPQLGSWLVRVPSHSGLVGWWRGDGDASDSAGTNSGTLQNGATFAAGTVNQAFSFDGIDDEVSVPDSPSLRVTGQITIAAWIKYASCDHTYGWCNIVSKAPDGQAVNWNYGLIVNRFSGQMAFTNGNGSSYFTQYGGPNLKDNSWHHVAVAYGAGTVEYYVDGSQVFSAPNSVPLTANTAALEIGRESGEIAEAAAFGGQVDELQIYNCVLTPAKIQAIVNTGLPGGCNSSMPFVAGAVNVWVGLKNSDAVGIRFDLRAEVYQNGTQLIGSGEVASVAGGSSGFNNAHENAITLTPSAGVTFVSGDTLSLRLLVRNACAGSGKNSGTARLWYNDSAADSNLVATIGTPAAYYLVSGFALASGPAAGPKNTMDVAAGAKCSAYKEFGTWSTTLP